MKILINLRVKFDGMCCLSHLKVSSPVQSMGSCCRLVGVSIGLVWRWASHFKLDIKVFYVIGKALSGELSCMGTGLVYMVL